MMKKLALAALITSLLAGTSALKAQGAPEKNGPQKEHEWLKQFERVWEAQGQVIESARMLGGLWIVSEAKITTPDSKQVSAMLTLGYDPQKKKYVGTWIDSTTSYLWIYEGTVDPSGKILTVEAEGPNPLVRGKPAKFKDVHEFKGKDQKVLTSSVLGEDGKWNTFVTVNYRRRK
jgi:hypothetical protein